MPREAKHLRPRNKEKTKTTSFGGANSVPLSKTCTAPQNSKHPNYIFRTNERCPAKQNTYSIANLSGGHGASQNVIWRSRWALTRHDLKLPKIAFSNWQKIKNSSVGFWNFTVDKSGLESVLSLCCLECILGFVLLGVYPRICILGSWQKAWPPQGLKIQFVNKLHTSSSVLPHCPTCKRSCILSSRYIQTHARRAYTLAFVLHRHLLLSHPDACSWHT